MDIGKQVSVPIQVPVRQPAPPDSEPARPRREEPAVPVPGWPVRVPEPVRSPHRV